VRAAAAADPAGTEQTLKVEAALREGQAIMHALRGAEYGKWKGFYTDGDWPLDVPLSIRSATADAILFEAA
jgi:hypothetical protein